jgi:hypothetical protein
LSGGHATVDQALTQCYQRGLMVGAFFVLAATGIALFAPNVRQTEEAEEEQELELAA